MTAELHLGNLPKNSTANSVTTQLFVCEKKILKQDGNVRNDVLIKDVKDLHHVCNENMCGRFGMNLDPVSKLEPR